MKLRHAISFVAFALMVAYAVYYVAELGVRIGPPSNRVNVSMQVPDVNGLVVDSNVLLRGVPVGKITGIDTSTRSADIRFYIDGDHPIPVDSEVRLENLSALGESYIALIPHSASGPMFHDGQQVTTENITAPASISELSTSLARVLNQMEPDQLNRLVDETDRALPDRDMVLPNLTRASSLLRDTVRGMNGEGAEMLGNLQTLLQNAGFVGPILADNTAILYQAAQPVGDLFENSHTLVLEPGGPVSIENFGRLLGRVQNFLDTRAPDLKVWAQTLMPNIEGIAAASMNLDTGKILTNMLAAIPEDGTITLRVTVPPK